VCHKPVTARYQPRKNRCDSIINTVSHELLHTWWMNQHQTGDANSGHGTGLGRSSNDQDGFARRLRDFCQAMDGLEKCPKASPNP
jgi:hypothetical protein